MAIYGTMPKKYANAILKEEKHFFIKVSAYLVREWLGRLNKPRPICAFATVFTSGIHYHLYANAILNSVSLAVTLIFALTVFLLKIQMVSAFNSDAHAKTVICGMLQVFLATVE